MNPFKYGCTVDGEYFCRRPALERELASCIESGQNVVIQGERRTGKTSLVLETVRRTKGVALFHADLLCVRDRADLCRRLASALGRLESGEGWLARVLRSLAHLRPFVAIDPASGSPTVSVDARLAAEPDSVESVLDALIAQTAKRRICVVLDEFQDILDIDDGLRMLAVMRSRIQLDPRTPYVFLGSVQNRMSDIFWKHSSPFFHSAKALRVGEIDADDFFKFLRGRFATGKRVFPRELFDAVSAKARNIPGFVQELCDAIWQVSSPGDVLGDDTLRRGLETIFARERDHYAFAVKSLTALQTRVLAAIAERGGREICSAAFMERAGTRNATSAKKAVAKLEREDIVYFFEGEYRLTNPFFGEWMKRLP